MTEVLLRNKLLSKDSIHVFENYAKTKGLTSLQKRMPAPIGD